MNRHLWVSVFYQVSKSGSNGKETPVRENINKVLWIFDKYMLSGKQDKSCYKEEIITANYNVFSCYDSQNCKPKFYEGHFNDDFDIVNAQPVENSLDGYLSFLKTFDDELPEKFYMRRNKIV